MDEEFNKLVGHCMDHPEEAARELARLRKIQAAALRVASSRRNRIVTDRAVLDFLDAALEASN